jgi:AraC-like DNA-binding protein
MSAIFKVFKPSLLDDVVESIGDWDIPDCKVATTLTIKHPPGTSICLIMQYRMPLLAYWHFGDTRHQLSECKYAATQVQTGVVSVRPRGPFGVIVACLKPELAMRILGAPPNEYANEKIDVKGVFGATEVALLEEVLAESNSSVERASHFELFLMAHLRCDKPLSAARNAAFHLRTHPNLSISRLASKLGMSRRHLSRSFRAMFGTSPKLFARLARIEKVLVAHSKGWAWSDCAYACGFADHAHMIRDFQDIVGQSPVDLFRPISTEHTFMEGPQFAVPYLVFRPMLSGAHQPFGDRRSRMQ